MILSYKACMKLYKTDYQLEKQLRCGKLYKIEKGIYSDTQNVSEMEVIMQKYSNAIFTLDSAFYFHSLTDVIPDSYILATDRDFTKIRDKRVRQIFCRKNLLNVGRISKEYGELNINIYNKERLLIELIRYKNRLPFDYYKEIIASYRAQIMTLDIELIQDYVEKFSKSNKIMETIQMEVF